MGPSPRFFQAMRWFWFGIALLYFFGSDDSAAGVGCIVMAELMMLNEYNARKDRRLASLDSSCAPHVFHS
jgi:hypothetical protein